MRWETGFAIAGLLFCTSMAAAAQSTAPSVSPAGEPNGQQGSVPPELTSPTDAPQGPTDFNPAPRRRGQVYSWLSFGSTFAYSQAYGNVNIGGGYLFPSGLAPNFELGLVFGNTPHYWTFRPGLTWYLPILPLLRPYVGAFYVHWIVSSGLPDQNGIGGRLGFSLGRFVTIGVTYDHGFDCTNGCNAWTPELSAGISL
jgi:hypothetical protein